ncbi:conjugal transfer protein TraD [Neorhizobium sp. DT-125]|uniref:conjugal transfer protein TraD n=1 Tax=Neorhizobium sp. DT-125 TaxID=3396163 RepID=UPI003F1BC93C
MTERKRDTREKIALGGLVVKAGLRSSNRAFLLGALIEASHITPGSAAYSRLAAIGRKSFGAEPRQPTKGEEDQEREADEKDKTE